MTNSLLCIIMQDSERHRKERLGRAIHALHRNEERDRETEAGKRPFGKRQSCVKGTGDWDAMSACEEFPSPSLSSTGISSVCVCGRDREDARDQEPDDGSGGWNREGEDGETEAEVQSCRQSTARDEHPVTASDGHT